MYHQFNIQQFYVLLAQTVFMCFVWIWEQTAIISLYSINWLVCITETECVYCAVRTGCFLPRINGLTQFRRHPQWPRPVSVNVWSVSWWPYWLTPAVSGAHREHVKWYRFLNYPWHLVYVFSVLSCVHCPTFTQAERRAEISPLPQTLRQQTSVGLCTPNRKLLKHCDFGVDKCAVRNPGSRSR